MTPSRVVDAHVHLGPPKYASADRFAAAMHAEGIAAAVLVQHLGNTDNSYLETVRATDPARFAALAIVDDVGEVGGAVAAGFAGLRVAPTGLGGPDGPAVFDALDDAGAAASITGPMSDVTAPQFRTTVRRHPRVRFRIEHMGGFRYGASEPDRAQFVALLRLADEPNVTLMWSGFFLNAGTRFPYPNTHDDLAATLRAFGSQRIMWSGDWNRAALASDDYREAIDLVERVTDDDAATEDILVRTACRVFGVDARRLHEDREEIDV